MRPEFDGRFNLYLYEPFKPEDRGWRFEKPGYRAWVALFDLVGEWSTMEYCDENYWYSYHGSMFTDKKPRNQSPEPAFAGLFSVGELLDGFEREAATVTITH